MRKLPTEAGFNHGQQQASKHHTRIVFNIIGPREVPLNDCMPALGP